MASSTDNWCTPKWFTDLLPVVDLDPPDIDALDPEIDWRHSAASIFVNCPYSDPLPWCVRAVSFVKSWMLSNPAPAPAAKAAVK